MEYWDASGNRIGITVGVDEYSFVYDVTAGVPAVMEEVTPGGTVKYFRTPGGTLIARVKGADWRYYHYDEIGSTRMLTDNSGNVTDTYTYDAYGSVISHSGITTDNPYQYVGALGYYTHYQCPEVKLLQLGFRFYDPETGRFTQLDPIRSGLNWYEYCGGSPLAWVDPLGLWQIRIGNYLEFNSSDILPGLQTGLAAVGSAATFGLWDGGQWKDEPGFGVSKGLGYVGIAAAGAAGAYAAGPAVARVAPGLFKVTPISYPWATGVATASNIARGAWYIGITLNIAIGINNNLNTASDMLSPGEYAYVPYIPGLPFYVIVKKVPGGPNKGWIGNLDIINGLVIGYPQVPQDCL